MSLRKKLISWNSSWTFSEENGIVNENPNLELQTWFYFIFCAVHYQQCFRWGKKNCCCVLFLLPVACLFGKKKKQNSWSHYSWNGIPILNEPSWDQLVDLTFYLTVCLEERSSRTNLNKLKSDFLWGKWNFGERTDSLVILRLKTRRLYQLASQAWSSLICEDLHDQFATFCWIQMVNSNVLNVAKPRQQMW